MKIIKLPVRASSIESVRELCEEYALAFPERIAEFHRLRNRRIGWVRRAKEFFQGR